MLTIRQLIWIFKKNIYIKILTSSLSSVKSINTYSKTMYITNWWFFIRKIKFVCDWYCINFETSLVSTIITFPWLELLSVSTLFASNFAFFTSSNWFYYVVSVCNGQGRCVCLPLNVIVYCSSLNLPNWTSFILIVC